MSFYNNTFDSCDFIPHSTGNGQQVMYCINFMNNHLKHFVYDNQYSMCKNHYCVVTNDVSNLEHRVVSCSGAIIRFNENDYFNPINTKRPLFDDLVKLPSNIPDFLSFGNDYYYLHDSRTTFNKDVMKINCTNDYKTCVEFDDGSSRCFGNISNIKIFDSLSSFIIGSNMTLIIVSMIYLGLKPYFRYARHVFTFFNIVFPVLAIALILNGTMAIITLPYVLGCLVIVCIVPMFMDHLNNKIKKV